MANTNSAKGNPAAKRMSNPKHKETRARSRKRGELRKARNRADNEMLMIEAKRHGGMGRRERRRHPEVVNMCDHPACQWCFDPKQWV